jgi:hypothetical protein
VHETSASLSGSYIVFHGHVNIFHEGPCSRHLFLLLQLLECPIICHLSAGIFPAPLAGVWLVTVDVAWKISVKLQGGGELAASLVIFL